MPVDPYEWFSRKVFSVAGDLQLILGVDYLRVVQPVMDELQKGARLLNLSVLKVFEIEAAPLLQSPRPPIRLWLLMAAVAELHLLRYLPGGDRYSGSAREGRAS
jgi:hypothetical protein